MPPQPSDGMWAQVGQQGAGGQPPMQGPLGGPPGPPSQPPPAGVSPQAPMQPPNGTPNLIQSGPQGQPNSALIQSMLRRG